MKKKEMDIVASGIKVRCAYDRLEEPKDLKAHPMNPNKHPAKQIELYHKIVSFQGWRRPITVSTRSGFVTRGHGALQMSLQTGLQQVPVDYQDYDSEQEELADLAADNLLTELSEMDNQKLQTLMTQVDTGVFDMELTGLDTNRLEKLFVSFGKAPEIGLTTPTDLDEDEGSENSLEMSEFEEEKPEAPAAQPAAATPHVRMVQLYLNEANIDEFISNAAFLQEKLGTANLTDTVFEVLKNARAAAAQG